MNRVFFNYNHFTLEQLNTLISCSNGSLSIVGNADVDLYPQLKEKESEFFKVYSNRYIEEVLDSDEKLGVEYYDLLNRVLSDSNIYLMKDRFFESKYRIGFPKKLSMYDYHTVIADEVADYYKKWRHFNFNITIARSTAHTYPFYVHQLVAESLDVKYLTVHRSVNRNYHNLSIGRGASRRQLKINIDESCIIKSDYLSNSKNLIETAQKSYEEAIHPLDRGVFQKNANKIFNLPKQIARNLMRPDWVINYISCYRQLQSLQVKVDKASKYLVFFLHYQPERTSSPEGGIFAQQYVAIRTLRALLPKDVKIYVREHPATYLKDCRPYVRKPEWYRRINALQNVFLSDITEDPFEVIDHALAVATLTGNVGVESLLRGVPVVYFGMSPNSDLKFQHTFESSRGLKDFLECVLKKDFEKNEIQADTMRCIEQNVDYVFDFNYKASGAPEKLLLVKSLSKIIAANGTF